MAVLDHWHPVLCSSQLGRQPVGVRLHGKELVLFRAEGGQIGALEDRCPHRRMRLSAGKVVKDFSDVGMTAFFEFHIDASAPYFTLEVNGSRLHQGLSDTANVPPSQVAK